MTKTTTSPTFLGYELAQGWLDLPPDEDPANRMATWTRARLALPPDATHMGVVYDGTAELDGAAGTFSLGPMMIFAVPGPATIRGAGRGLVMSRSGYRGLFQISGPLEATGRLRYIDGCTDSLVIPPAVYGDPCLNLLHIPPQTEQTQHTHPSVRFGLILSGRGRCVTPEGEIPLAPGLPFRIRKDGMHSFHTDDAALRVLAWHPDSDFGPTHEDHPMVNRTLIPESRT